MNRLRVIAQSGGVLFMRIIGALLQLTLVLLAVLWFSISDVGVNGIIWSVAVMARVGGTLGLDLYTYRLAEASDVRESQLAPGSIASINATFLKYCALPCTVSALVLLTLVCLSNMAWWIACIPFIVLFSAHGRLVACLMRSNGSVYASQSIDTLLVPGLGVSAAVVAGLVRPEAFIALQVLVFPASSLLLLAFVRLSRSFARALCWSEFRSEVLPLGAGSSLTALASRMPVVIVGSDSLSGAAIYDIGQRVQSAALLATSAATSVVLPRVNRMMELRQYAELRGQVRQAIVFSCLPGIAILVGLLGLGPDRTGDFLGADYQQSWLVSILLVSVAVFNGLTGIYSGLAAMLGLRRQFVVIAAVQVTVVLSAGFVFFRGEPEKMALLLLFVEILRGIAYYLVCRPFLRRRSAAE